ncbi:MAG TPA: HAD family phosphatase [Polyangiales bacterium]|nr:HAD family phosphatase [Polyangiales bacterium]
MSSYRAVIFDMDGTIVDNMRFHSEAWATVARKLGSTLTPEQFERDFAGKKNEELVPLLSAQPLSAEEVARVSEEKELLYRAAYGPHLAPLAGFRELVASLRAQGMKLLVATAAPRANRDFVFEGLGLHSVFEGVVGAEDAARGKPFPDIFLRASELAGVPPGECLVFEDAVNGVLAARAAGMDVVAVLTTTPAELLAAAGARWTVTDYRTIPAEVFR